MIVHIGIEEISSEYRRQLNPAARYYGAVAGGNISTQPLRVNVYPQGDPRNSGVQ